MDEKSILTANQENYRTLYKKKSAFLRYPADWVIRFHNMYLKQEIPAGRVLDYGCGSLNNGIFFLENGYEVHGVDVSDEAGELVRLNLESKGLDPDAANFTMISPDNVSLPFDDGYFDFIMSNQVLYYLPTKGHIRQVTQEMSRVLRPGGIVFFTMLGPKNYYITHHAKAIYDNVYEVRIEDKNHRLYGVQELIYLVRDENELADLFSVFDCVSTGFFDQKMFDLRNFHWIFVGKKAP